MFESLSQKFESALRKIRGTGIITEKNIEDVLKDIRMSLLEADVNYKVVKEFTEEVRKKALGESVLKSISPDQQFVKIVHNELASFLGNTDEASFTIPEPPFLIMLVGLQGSGKTTTAAKLGRWLLNENKTRSVLLVGADTYRPAAKDQLQKLSALAGCGFFTEPHDDAVKICVHGLEKAEKEGYTTVIFDTAGRLHIDEDMISEIKKIREIIPLHEVLLVADAMLGQESVNVAKSFNESVRLTGLILTKTDGDARGGAALSMKHAANVPVKFAGTGEKIDRFERFHAERMASRILGMGDIVSLVEKVQKTVTEEDAKRTEEKMRKGSFTLHDFLEQMKAMKEMGPLEEMLKMIPGASDMGLNNVKIDEREIKHTEAIILSMTPKERSKPDIIEFKRRNRIAKGSGTTPERVNKLLKQFGNMKKMMKKMGKKSRFHNKNPFGNFGI